MLVGLVQVLFDEIATMNAIMDISEVMQFCKHFGLMPSPLIASAIDSGKTLTPLPIHRWLNSAALNPFLPPSSLHSFILHPFIPSCLHPFRFSVLFFIGS